ncbi:MAG: hypothetical protein JWO08_1176 [Verrucomicrobiaceae bacterium]|nr:hypothetical protein [Verrucomicrobiaceae bacterium]
MSDTPTSESYSFSTFQELVDRVPSGRISDCMEELGIMLQSTKAMIEVTVLAAAHLAGRPDYELPAHVMDLPEVLTWTDDGKKEIQSTIKAPEGMEMGDITLKFNGGQQP